MADRPHHCIELAKGQKQLVLEDKWPEKETYQEPPKPLARRLMARSGYEVLVAEVLNLRRLYMKQGKFCMQDVKKDEPEWKPFEEFE